MMDIEKLNCIGCHHMHPDNGNCTAVGGFCTAVPASSCPLIPELRAENEKLRDELKSDWRNSCLNYLSNACKNIRKRECPDIIFNRADYIRSMSNEEMARELIDIICDLCENGVPSYDFVLKWLRGSMEE